MTDCLFCKIIAGEIPCEKIYEDEYTFAFLDIKPLNEGHMLVLPKKHFQDILTVPQETFTYVMKTVHMLAPVIKEVVYADGVNLGINTGAAAGQVIFHLHAHIIPRYSGDGYLAWKRNTVTTAVKETQAKIISALKKLSA